MNALELFAGAGGLALGVGQAGFNHLALVELEPHACETIKNNQRQGHSIASKWPLHEGDVRRFDYSQFAGKVDLLTAGVPCQPFSVAGKGKAQRDKRDMFSEVVRAARELRPKAILIENVKGLLRPRFQDYFDYLLLAIASAGFARDGDETWEDHYQCLQRHREARRTASPQYEVHVHSVNAADYGVPQWRERVLIVAFRVDLNVSWTLPPATHSLDALLWSQWRTGDYWKRHGLNRCRPGLMTKRIKSRLPGIQEPGASAPTQLPWLTVRDALHGLPSLRVGQKDPNDCNHYLNPGARPYARHSGSLIDEPAKALKAGSHGVPGGENTLALGGHSVRYFSVRECARIQSFPDDYVFVGPWSRTMRQVGNAVPVALAKAMASAIRERLELAPSISASASRVTNLMRAG